MTFFEHALRDIALVALASVVVGTAAATLLRRRHLTWTWAALGLPTAWALFWLIAVPAAALGLASLYACLLGARWHHSDRHQGGDLAQIAARRVGMRAVARRLHHRSRVKREGWLRGDRLIVGEDARGLPVQIPVGLQAGCHTLVVGATGAGKTVSETWIACRLIERGHGAIVIDPKGDRELRRALITAADARGAEFLEWTPEGPLPYNPYGQGSDSEIADKALAGEVFTEPHYLRQAQRYLGHAVRAMRAARIPITPVSLMAQLDPRALDVTARSLPQDGAEELQRYLDSLGERQRRELTGVRDRLSILAESDARKWLEPKDGRGIDLADAVAERAVVYLRLDADRRALLSQMLAGAIVSDLVTLVSRLQADPTPTVVVIDEFAAVAAHDVARVFGRARSAGVSLILGAQELADLKKTAEGLREQVLANVSSVIAHRQNVPESAELIAAMAGTKPAWITTEQTGDGFISRTLTGQGTRRRGYEYELHPSQIKQLPTGVAAVIAPGSGQAPTVARICHWSRAH